MKIYILSLLLLPLLFSCNQKPVSENQETEVVEEIREKKQSVIAETPFDFENYNDAELDSIFRLSLDSMIDFLNVTEFDKDTVIENYFTHTMYGQAKFGFPEFVVLDSKYLDAMDSIEYQECPMYIYVKKDSKFELSATIMTTLRSWMSADMYRQDMNFDDKVDLIISRPSHMASRSISDFYLFTKQNLNKSTHIVSTHELLANDNNKTVISFSDGGNFGTHVATINQWKGNNLVRTRQLEKTSNYQKEGFTMEEFIIRKGKEIKIKAQVLNQDKAEEYFDNYK